MWSHNNDDVPSGLPKVKLVYGDDYEAVKNLPRRRVRRTTKKRGAHLGWESSDSLGHFGHGVLRSTSVLRR